jgi:spore germination cell wall hydrolase CwlJ-like protein
MNLTRFKHAARKHGVAPALAVSGAAVAAVLGMSVSALSKPSNDLPLSPAALAAAAEGSDSALLRFKAGFDPSLAALVSRHDPAGVPDLWGRPDAWSNYDVSRAPSLGLGVITTADAQVINSLIPGSGAPPAKPFVLQARNDAERARALKCMTQAVYYEAALEPRPGQEAVAQVVLNRLRHPEYPNSVCEVVYQGWERWTGCQFSFTCDGSLLNQPMPLYWRQAESVAVAALNGHVASSVGTATHYHADYVMPYWRSSLTKVGQIGAHIFYRWPGRAGTPPAFTDAYRPAGELRLTNLVLAGRAARPTPKPSDLQQLPGLPGDAPVAVETIVVADANGETTTRVRSIIGGRRIPTKAEIAAINAFLSRTPAPAEVPVLAQAPAPLPVRAPEPYAAPPVTPPAKKTPDVVELPVTEVNKPAAAETAPAA